jgi:protocatechuate 3,4-dioxygenase beta subunit
MGRRRLDNIRGSWLALVILACLGVILGLGLGSEKVRRIARENLPAMLGGRTKQDESFWKDQEKAAAAEAKDEKPAEDALPVVPEKESFRGTVEDEKGQPIKGATVQAQRWRESSWESLGTARTDSLGRFVLGPVPRANLSVIAGAEGFASLRKQARTGATLEFILKPGGTLAGKVVDAKTGTGVADCSLRGWSQSGNWWETVECDKEGGFRFNSVPPGRVWLDVYPKLHRATSLGDVEVRSGEETFKEIPVVAGGTLTGKVLDRETKVPVPNARIRTWEGQKEALSGEDGTYVLQGPSAGGLSLRVSAEGYPEQWSWIQVIGDPDGETKQDIEIGKGGKVTGLVRNSDGEPVVGARVGRAPGELMTGVPENTATTDAEGRFTLDAVPSMNNGRLFAIADDYALSRSDPLTVRAGTESAGIVITLLTGAVFKGTVMDEEDQPVPGAQFTLQRQWSQQDGGWFWIPGLVGYSVADGSWEIAQVPEGNYTLTVSLDGYAPETRKPLQGPATGEVPGLDFVLRRGGVITGWVRSLAGEPVVGATVNAWGWVVQSDGTQSWAQRSDVRSNDEGYFVLDGLRDGAYQVNIEATGFTGEGLGGIAAGARDLQITLHPTARIEGRVLELDGVTPVPNFTIKVVQEMDNEGNPANEENVIAEQEFADREGKFLLQNLTRGQVAIYAVAGNRISRRREGIFVTPGGLVDNVLLVVSEGGRLRVRVRDHGGSAVDKAYVSAGVRTANGQVNYQHGTRTNDQGEAVIVALPEGAYELYANHGDVQATKSVVVASGVETEADLTLKLGAAVAMHVVDSEGRPVEGAQVDFFDREGGEQIQLNWSKLWRKAQARYGNNIDWNEIQRAARQTDASGYLLREGVPDGSVFVSVNMQGFKPAGSTVRTIDGFQVEHRIVLEAAPKKEDGDGTADDGEEDEEEDF